MIVDKLTRAERLRLEAFNQAVQASGAALRGGVDVGKLFADAEAIEAWLRKAREDA